MIGGGGYEVSIMPVFYPRGTVSVSSLGYFHLLVILIKLLVLTFLSLSEHAIFNSISRIRGRGIKNTLSHSRIRPVTRSGGRKLE